MTSQPNQDKDELTRIIVAAMERGNLYDGYVSSAEFNVEAVKVVNELLPRLHSYLKARDSKLIQAVLGEVESLGPRDRKPDYSKHYATSNGGLTNVTTENLQDEGFNESSKVWRTVLSCLKKKYEVKE